MKVKFIIELMSNCKKYEFCNVWTGYIGYELTYLCIYIEQHVYEMWNLRNSVKFCKI